MLCRPLPQALHGPIGRIDRLTGMVSLRRHFGVKYHVEEVLSARRSKPPRPTHRPEKACFCSRPSLNPAFLSTPYRFFLNSAANRRMVATAMRAALARLRPIWPILAPLALAACGGGNRLAQSSGTERFYTAPGPPSDPWRPYIQEASTRFHIPGGWIRAIIRQESGGHEYLHGRPVTSDAGAMGLMQLMPATYAELRDRFGLGNDPYDPHDNIMAGTGYIAELYARFGAPAFLVAYDAGPRRMDEYNAGRGKLPNETVAYLASVAPALSPQEGPMTGPLAAYARSRPGARRAPVQVYAAYTRSAGRVLA